MYSQEMTGITDFMRICVGACAPTLFLLWQVYGFFLVLLNRSAPMAEVPLPWAHEFLLIL